jgi:ATP-dependent DNA helicase RecQ
VDATVAAQKLLSCVYRIRAQSGFSTGLHHVADVLVGKKTEKVLDWGHDRLSTFGVGSEYDRGQWLGIGSELVRLGWLDVDPQHKTLVLTEEGVAALREQRAFAYAKRPKTARAKTKNAAPGGALFELLRGLRKRIAEAVGVPPYVVFSDATLREFAAQRPATLQAFRGISGVGDTKLERYGEAFVEAIREHEAAG